MAMRKSKNNAFFLTLIFLDSISPTLPLFCSKECSIRQVRSTVPFIEPSARTPCRNDTSTGICKGRIIAYYNDRSYPSYINYTLGGMDDSSEREYENYVNTYGLENFMKYQVIINGKTEETKIIADLYCTTADECALVEIKNLFKKYRHQMNPFHPIKPLIYAHHRSRALSCYDASSEATQRCETTSDQSPACLSYSKELKQECVADTQIGVHVEFTLSSPYVAQFDTTNELVKCNVNNCNHVLMLTKIKNIIRQYAYEVVSMTTTNSAQREHKGTMTNVLSVCFLSVLLFT